MPHKVYSINCTWRIGHGTDINNLVTVDELRDNTSTKSINIDDITGTDRAVLFIKNTQSTADHDDDCQLKINTGPRHTLTQVAIVCDSDVVELFTGSYEEYNQTYRGELLDEFDGIKSHLFEIKLKKDINCISLKFITLTDQLWIYGVHVYITENPINIFQPSVNIGNVDEYLSDRGISESANKCKEFIEMHMNSNRATGPPNMAALMSFINGKVEDKLSEMEFATEENSSSPKNNNFRIDDSDRKERPEVTSVPSPFGLENSIDMVKTYFDNKFREIENTFMKKIDERFRDFEKKQDEKLNQIINLLQK